MSGKRRLALLIMFGGLWALSTVVWWFPELFAARISHDTVAIQSSVYMCALWITWATKATPS